jgi:hypothetical protein
MTVVMLPLGSLSYFPPQGVLGALLAKTTEAHLAALASQTVGWIETDPHLAGLSQSLRTGDHHHSPHTEPSGP